MIAFKSYGIGVFFLGILALGIVPVTVSWAQTQGTAEDNLKQKNITLPPPGEPIATYVGAVRSGNLLFLSGHGPVAVSGGVVVSGPPGLIGAPFKPGGPQLVKSGKVGKDYTLEQGYGAARRTGLNLLATARAALGSLNKVKRVVKVLGMVNAAPGFTEMPKVINGCSDLMIEVFGDKIGAHARSAVGVSELYGNSPVEIEMVLEVE